MKIRKDNLLITLPFLGFVLFLGTLPFSVTVASIFFFFTFIISLVAAFILFNNDTQNQTQ